MVPFPNLILGLHNSSAFFPEHLYNYNASPEHLVGITDSLRFTFSLLLGRATIRAKTIDSSSVMETTPPAKACAAGSLCQVKHLPLYPNKHMCPDCEKPVHGMQCGAPSGNEDYPIYLGTRCHMCQNKLKRPSSKSSNDMYVLPEDSDESVQSTKTPQLKKKRGASTKASSAKASSEKAPSVEASSGKAPKTKKKKENGELIFPFDDLTFDNRDRYVIEMEVDEGARRMGSRECTYSFWKFSKTRISRRNDATNWIRFAESTKRQCSGVVI
jgi:hypothetical protein